MTNIRDVAHWYALFHGGDEHVKARVLAVRTLLVSGMAGMQLVHPYLIFATILRW
jgi:hypothetical protein